MGMGFTANFADTVERKTLEKVVGADKVDAIYKQIDDCFDSNFCAIEYLTDDDPSMYGVLEGKEDDAKSAKEAYSEIQRLFTERTGMHITLGNHDSDSDGDRYDDLDGLYWQVLDGYQPTPAMVEFQKKYGEFAIDRQFFVIYC